MYDRYKIADISLIIGAVAFVAAGVLWLTWPSSKAAARLDPSPLLRGSF